jgi:hypothetical protein
MLQTVQPSTGLLPGSALFSPSIITSSNHAASQSPQSGIGDAIGDYRPVSIAAQRLDMLAKMLGLKIRKSKPRNGSRSHSYLSEMSILGTDKKRRSLGFLHYKTWVSPPKIAGQKRIMNLVIIEAEGLEQGYFSRWPYVKLIHGSEVYKTPPSNKSTASPIWNLSFKFELDEEDMVPIHLEVWATRTMGSDWMMGKLVFVPAMRHEELSEFWEALLPSSSSLKFQQEVSLSLLKRAHRVAKKSRESTPEHLFAKRMEIRRRKALTLEAERNAVIAAGWGHALIPQQIIKKRRLPLSIARHLPLICFIAFIIFIIIIAFLPDELLTLFGI